MNKTDSVKPVARLRQSGKAGAISKKAARPAKRKPAAAKKKRAPGYVNDDYRIQDVGWEELGKKKPPFGWEIYECRPSCQDPRRLSVVLRRAKMDAPCAKNILGLAAQYFREECKPTEGSGYTATISFLAGKLGVSESNLESWLIKSGVADSRVPSSFKRRPACRDGMVLRLKKDSVLRLCAQPYDRSVSRDGKRGR